MGKGESAFLCFCLFARNVLRQMASWLAFIGRQSVAMISGFRFGRIFIIGFKSPFTLRLDWVVFDSLGSDTIGELT